jgi:general secretion pathway protein D
MRVKKCCTLTRPLNHRDRSLTQLSRFTCHRFLLNLLITFSVVLLQSCASQSERGGAALRDQLRSAEALPIVSYPGTADAAALPKTATLQSPEARSAFIQKGSGRFINESLASQRPDHSVTAGGDINLQFNNTEISEVVRTIFGELLKQPYILSPAVRGNVTFSTAKPIARSQLRYVLELILGWNSAALVLREEIFHVVPISEAVPGNISPSFGSLPNQPGYEVQIFPLKYITAIDMQKLLKPFLTKYALLQTDDARNLLILAGTRDQLQNYQRTIDIFDVDWLEGMSIGMFPLDVTEPDVIIVELNQLLGDVNSPVAAKIRLMPMARLNSIVVITPLPEYLEKVRRWIDRLDRQMGESIEQRLFVYSVNNMDSKKLSDILNSLFTGAQQTTPRPTQNATSIKLTSRGIVSPGLAPVEVDKNGVSRRLQETNTGRSPGTGIGISSFQEAPISISAVEENNALLIKASPKQYKDIVAAIRQLDVAPLQVLIQATILEVSLTDVLEYGVEWYLNNAADGFLADGKATGDGSMRLGSGGFSYLLGSGDLGAAISALESSGKTKLLSSPSLWALNNELASINVGTQIPVTTTRIDTSGTGDEIKEVQFRDTGVILKVTPRIHPGGLVYLKVDLNISNPLPEPEGENPTVAQRALKTKIAVESGQTILLGGLIAENNIEGRSGLPFLSRVPILKYFFGSTNNNSSRTEIIAMITPTVIFNRVNADNIMDDYRREFEYIYPKDLAVDAEINVTDDNKTLVSDKSVDTPVP